jgi:hypothetical protein
LVDKQKTIRAPDDSASYRTGAVMGQVETTAVGEAGTRP